MKLARATGTTSAALAALAVLSIVVQPPAATAASVTVVVNEVSKAGSYVELRNLRADPVDISGWSVWSCHGYQGAVHRLVVVPDGHRVPGRGTYLAAGSRYTGSPAPDLVWNGTREQQGFPAVRITDASGAVVDQVGVTDGNPCVEKARAVTALSGSAGDRFALGRIGTNDTDDNSRDFADVERTPTPSGDRATAVRPPTPIWNLDTSTAGETHTVEGVVTGIDDRTGSDYNRIYPEQRGVFVQEEQRDADGVGATSDGIFVADVDRPADYRPGDVVRVTGAVLPNGSWPALPRAIRPKAVAGGGIAKVGEAPVPAPADIDPARLARDGHAYLATLSGMRVRLAEGTANSGGTNKFGEVFLTPGSERRRVFRDDPRADLIAVVDDAGAGNPANSYKDRSSSTRIEADLFDRLEDVVGPLGWSFEHYKVFPQPGAMPRLRPYEQKSYPVRLTPRARDEVRIASFNVENFFPAGVPVGGKGTENTPQGVPGEAEYDEQRAEILAALDDVLGRPDVVAIQEVYANANGSTALDDLARGLSRGAETYSAYVAKSNDGRGIANGYLVKSTVTVSNPRLLGATEPSSVCEAGKLFARPPFAIDLDVAGRTVTLLNNHFKSKGGADQGVPCRELQAAYVRDRVAEAEAAGGEAIVLGDLNSFEDETPLDILTDPARTSARNLWSRAPEGERYSYAFQGRLQTLDHLVVTDAVAASVRDFRYVPIDTDYADRVAPGGGRLVDGHGLSDHNPPVLTLSAPLSDPAPPADVPEAPWAAALLVAGAGAAALSFARTARRARLA